jgi:hypothetical protein
MVTELLLGLRSLDHKKFEQLCFDLLKERHPEIEIRHVDGAGGDEGLDIFSGDLDGRPVIWQCKSFPHGIGKSQKEQVRKSLRQALGYFNASLWVLCIPIDMDVKAQRWFQNLKKSYAAKVPLDVWDASQMVHELLHRRTLRNAYFPNVAIDVATVRELIHRTGEMSDEQLASLTAENAEQYLDRLKARDARFSYEIAFGHDSGPIPDHPRHGLVVSIFDGTKRIDVIARDVQALNLNPPKLTVGFKGLGVQKIVDVVRRGGNAEFAPEEIGEVTTDFGFLMPKLTTAGRFRVTQRVPKHTIPFRVTFGKGPHAVLYDWMAGSVVRGGTQEAELLLTSKAPFGMRVRMDADQGVGSVTIEPKLSGARIRDIHKLQQAAAAIHASHWLELFNLEQDRVFVGGEVTDLQLWNTGVESFLLDAIMICDAYGADLRLPERFAEQDEEVFNFLKALAMGEVQTSGNMSMGITVSAENRDQLLAFVSGRNSLRLERPEHDPPLVLFGGNVRTGPIAVEALDAKVTDEDGTRQAILNAQTGDVIRLHLASDVIRHTRMPNKA